MAKLEYSAWWAFPDGGSDSAYVFHQAEPSTPKEAMEAVYRELHAPYAKDVLRRKARLMVVIKPPGVNVKANVKDAMPGAAMDAWGQWEGGGSDAAYDIVENNPRTVKKFLSLAYALLMREDQQRWMEKDRLGLVLMLATAK